MITGYEFVLGSHWFIDSDRKRIACRHDIGEYLLGVLDNYHHLNTLRNDLDERKRYAKTEPAEDGSRADGTHAPSAWDSEGPATPEVHAGGDED